jgi:hypothetical protein
MRKVSDKSFEEKKSTFYIQYFFPENHAIYDTMWEYTVETGSLQMSMQYGTCALHAW